LFTPPLTTAAFHDDFYGLVNGLEDKKELKNAYAKKLDPFTLFKDSRLPQPLHSYK
jgi:hypothetical protein